MLARTASSKRFRRRPVWATSLRIIFPLAGRLKLHTTHAKAPQDATAPAVLWLKATKTRLPERAIYSLRNDMQRTKPPFCADHVGSILRTAPGKYARATREKSDIRA